MRAVTKVLLQITLCGDSPDPSVSPVMEITINLPWDMGVCITPRAPLGVAEVIRTGDLPEARLSDMEYYIACGTVAAELHGNSSVPHADGSLSADFALGSQNSECRPQFHSKVVRGSTQYFVAIKSRN